MPFDFEDYERRLKAMDDRELHEEYDKYCRHAGHGAVGYGLGLAFMPLTFGLSGIGSLVSAGQCSNAAGKLTMVKNEKARRARA
jgi:hypothetical protein